jgi:hypothetical protein
MEQVNDHVREYAKLASERELLDRVTVYRGGLEDGAFEVFEQELRSRGVTDEQIAEHAGRLEPIVLWERPGLALRCSVCNRPAVCWGWRWHCLWGLLPLIPRWVRLCADHALN